MRGLRAAPVVMASQTVYPMRSIDLGVTALHLSCPGQRGLFVLSHSQVAALADDCLTRHKVLVRKQKLRHVALAVGRAKCVTPSAKNREKKVRYCMHRLFRLDRSNEAKLTTGIWYFPL
jgi:hypothetical protein